MFIRIVIPRSVFFLVPVETSCLYPAIASHSRTQDYRINHSISMVIVNLPGRAGMRAGKTGNRVGDPGAPLEPGDQSGREPRQSG